MSKVLWGNANVSFKGLIGSVAHADGQSMTRDATSRWCNPSP
jgi:hypothetical protein